MNMPQSVSPLHVDIEIIYSCFYCCRQCFTFLCTSMSLPVGNSQKRSCWSEHACSHLIGTANLSHEAHATSTTWEVLFHDQITNLKNCVPYRDRYSNSSPSGTFPFSMEPFQEVPEHSHTKEENQNPVGFVCLFSNTHSSLFMIEVFIRYLQDNQFYTSEMVSKV